LGATICLARAPRCLDCPAFAHCDARAQWFLPADSMVQPALPLMAESRATYAATAGRNGVAPARQASAPKPRVKQAEKFAGSRRWYRGRIVAALRALPAEGALGIEQLGPLVKSGFGTDDRDWLLDLVRGLARDGL